MASVMYDFKVGDKFQVKESGDDMTINKDYEALKVEDGYITCIDDVNESNEIWIGNIVPSFYKENKVKNPNVKHYELWNDFEVIDLIKNTLTAEEYIGALKFNILKYKLRNKGCDIEDNIKIEDYTRELNSLLGK